MRFCVLARSICGDTASNGDFDLTVMNTLATLTKTTVAKALQEIEMHADSLPLLDSAFLI